MIKLILIFTVEILIAIFYWIISDSLYHYFKIKKPYVDKIVYKKSNLFHRLFILFPQNLAVFFSEQNRNEFKEHGLILFSGPQGSGKTMAMTRYINEIVCKFPDCRILTNYNLMIQDDNLDSWQPLCLEKNGNKGIIFAFDEISNWFNCRNFQSFPKDLLTELCYNRKNHRVIVGTCQNISNVDVQIRRQCSEYRSCHCWGGFLQVVFVYRPEFDFEGNLEKLHFKKFYIFQQDKSLRYQYDTFSVVEGLVKQGGVKVE